MLAWLRSFGELARIGVECTGTYGAGLLRYLQHAGVTVLEVTAPDKHDRGKRGKDDTIDAENAAHAVFAQVRTVTPKTRDGMAARFATYDDAYATGTNSGSLSARPV